MGSLDKGWISLHRNLLDHWLWKEKPFSKAAAWIDLLLSANHEDKKLLFDGNLITVKRGQQITSLRKLGERWGWDKRTARKFLSMLENDGMVRVECTSRCTTITIINYGKYQDRGTSKRTTASPPNVPQRPHSVYTNNNDRTMKNNEKQENLLSEEEQIGYLIPDDEWEG